MRRLPPLAAALALAAVLAAGCSDDDGGSDDAGAPRTTSAPASGTDGSTGTGGVDAGAGAGGTTAAPGATDATGAPSPDATAAAGGAGAATTAPGSRVLPDGATAGTCPALPPIPEGTQDVSRDVGDFDADRSLDALVAWRQGGTWRLRVALSTGGGAEVEVPGVTSEHGLVTLGGTNLGGSPGAEAFAVVSQGAATTNVGVWALEACQLVRVLGADGQPAEFPVGGTVLNGSGLRCAEVGGGVQLNVLSARSQDGTTFTASSRPLRLEGNRFVDAGPPAERTLTAPEDDGPLSEYFRISCGGVAEPS